MSMMSPDVFQDQMFGLVMTLVNLHKETGKTHEQACVDTSKFLEDIASSLKTLPESNKE